MCNNVDGAILSTDRSYNACRITWDMIQYSELEGTHAMGDISVSDKQQRLTKTIDLVIHTLHQ